MEFDELSNRVADQFQRHEAEEWHQAFRSVTLRALRVLRGEMDNGMRTTAFRRTLVPRAADAGGLAMKIY